MFLDPVVNRFTRHILSTVNRRHLFMNILCIESFYSQKKTHNRALLFVSTFKYGLHFDYWNQFLNMRLRVWSVLPPSDTDRKFSASVTAVLLPFTTYLLALPRICVFHLCIHRFIVSCREPTKIHSKDILEYAVHCQYELYLRLLRQQYGSIALWFLDAGRICSSNTFVSVSTLNIFWASRTIFVRECLNRFWSSRTTFVGECSNRFWRRRTTFVRECLNRFWSSSTTFPSCY
jgi:hypothetical protein